MTLPQGDRAAVLFDMDGVLVDSTASHVVAWSRFLDERGIDHPELGIPSLFGRRAVDAVAGLLHVEPGSEAARSAVTVLERYADELLRATEPGDLVTPGAADLVRRLADDGWRLAVATSAHVVGVSSTATRQQLLDAGADVVVDNLVEVLPIVVERRQRRLANTVTRGRWARRTTR